MLPEVRLGSPTALVYSPDYLSYRLSPTHPLQPVRLEMTAALIAAYGLAARPDVIQVPPRVATDAELERFHGRAYLAAVRAARPGLDDPFNPFGLGTSDDPTFAGMHEASALVVGGSLVALESVLEGRCAHAFNFAGGLHHAMPLRASGFCIYNDVAVAIATARAQGLRVAYVDLDAHHGDGVQWGFYDDPQVLTVSIHESGHYLFPGTGFEDEQGSPKALGTAVNLPLEPNAGDAAYARAFSEVVGPVVRAFRPDLLVTQHGCDSHATDPLTHLTTTTRTYEDLARRLHTLAHECAGGRWLATGGGGYQLFTVVPRAWTLVFGAILGVDLPDPLPPSWHALCRERTDQEVPDRLRDAPLTIPPPAAARVDAALSSTIAALRRSVFPRHALSPTP
jgi:acetoin utilization protein AcuC